jgi:hypothetical protein
MRLSELTVIILVRIRGVDTQHRVNLMAGDCVARSVNKFNYIRIGGAIPLNEPQ